MAKHPPSSDLLVQRLSQAAQVERVAVTGGQVTWRGFGSGAPLVLLHGGHGSWLHWVRNIEALAARYTVWVPDLPGYGDSDLPAGVSLDDLVAATLQSLDRLVGAATSIGVAGFSFGGLVAARLAQQRGDVTHLALLGPAGHGGRRRPRGELIGWRGLESGSDAWTAVMRHNLLMHMLHDAAAVDEQALHIHGQSCLRTRFHSKTISRAGGLAELLHGRQGSLLLVAGEHDVTLVPDATAQRVAQACAGCSTHIVPQAGHWVQYEAAEAVNRLLLQWLAEPDSLATP